jgi:hypothetical protein
MIRLLRNRLDRRAVLRGAGVALALPWLDSIATPQARAASAASTVRLIYWFIPNGVIFDRWTPASPGPLDATQMPVCLQPIADAGMVGDFNVLSGLDNFAGLPISGGDHAAGMASLLTCSSAKKVADLSQIELAQSADQMAAAVLGKLTPRPSLELGMTPGGGTGACDTGYACAYSQSVSWVDAKTPRGKRTDPHDTWMYLLGTDNPSLTPEERERLRQGDKSVLDFVLDQANQLNGQVGVSDKAKLDQYFTAVRALEQQLTAALPAAQCRMQPDPGSANNDYVKRFNLLMDMMVFAVKCDLTRVITFMFANAVGPGPMPWIGVTDDYHNLTHQQTQPGVMDTVAKCITWFVQQAATFATKLKAIPEGNNNALYNTAFFVGSDVGDGGMHNHDKMPVLLAGNAGGAFTTGRHIAYTPEDPKARDYGHREDEASRTQALAIPNTNRMANLHLSLLHAGGVDVPKVGDSNGFLPNL